MRIVDLESVSIKFDPAQFRDVPSLVLNKAHPLSDLYYKRARYKVYWGGRGSAKSWGFAEALVRISAAHPVRVLCCREIQKSIKDSSHRILVDTIARLGLESWFTITGESIRSLSGAEFIFKGLRNNEQGIKSTEGIDICWVEEGQTVTAASWRTLSPTIRTGHFYGDQPEIWVSYNLIHENDATHRRFIAPDGSLVRSNSIVHKINYDSNPYFGGALQEEMEDDKQLDYHLYEHIWLGKPLLVSKAQVLYGKYRVAEFPSDLWGRAHRVFFGLDFGFSTDPNACIRFFTIDNVLYCEHEAYGTEIDLLDMDAFLAGGVGGTGATYEGIPGAKLWPMKADIARPETISLLKRQGFQISGAEKWTGCKEDGVAHLRGFKEIVIHPRCVNLIREAELWKYKTDPKTVDDHGQPLVLPVLLDKNDHGWDAIRYGLDGHIKRRGHLATWAKLAQD